LAAGSTSKASYYVTPYNLSSLGHPLVQSIPKNTHTSRLPPSLLCGLCFGVVKLAPSSNELTSKTEVGAVDEEGGVGVGRMAEVGQKWTLSRYLDDMHDEYMSFTSLQRFKTAGKCPVAVCFRM